MNPERGALSPVPVRLPADDQVSLRGRVQAQVDEIEAMRLQQGDLVRRVAELEGHVAAMRASTSWRITAPLRAIAQVARWSLSERPRQVVAECARLFQRERRQRGLLGMLTRVPRYWRGTRQVVTALDRRAAELPVGLELPGAPPRLHPELLEGIEDAPCIESTISVVIPTLNAGPEFAYLLRKLRTQLGVRRIEIVVIDSGSTDATVATARAAGATVVEIAPADFSHSASRNLGADTATGDHLLFMVQDAYPIGEHWAYGLLRYLLDHESEGLVALSCTEYCRDDSDMMYECGIATYYRFLGCKESDRIGVFRGADHESLRAMGQLSDVSCLIPRQRFLKYRYRGRFAEDLDLGVRLIRDGHRIAMLASVKVIHSHNRTSHYYLKRSFVDINFLVDVFPDFTRAACESAAGLVTGAVHVASWLSRWVPSMLAQGGGGSVDEATSRWLTELRSASIDGSRLPATLHLGDARVDAVLRELVEACARLQADGGAPSSQTLLQRSAQCFVHDFAARFDHFNRYAADVYVGEDPRLLREWTDAAGKTFAATLGASLADLCLDRRDLPETDAERQWLNRVAAQLTAGV